MMRCRHREAPHGCKCGGAVLGEDCQSRPGMDKRGCACGVQVECPSGMSFICVVIGL